MESTNLTPGQSSRQRRKKRSQRPPRWLMGVLSLCLALVVIGLVARSLRPGEPPEVGAKAAEETLQATETPTVSEPVATAAPTAAPTPAPAPEAVVTAAPTSAPMPTPVPQAPEKETGEESAPESVTPKDSGSWFSDAVFIGDSRVEGFRLYSGVTSEATFLDHTGLTVYEVKEGKKVIRRGDQKVSVLDALDGGTYGKVYLALGVNELGYFNPKGFAETTGEVVELIREKLPDTRIYIQSLIPVNTEKCKANDIPYYITNEGITGYNEALATYFADKDVYLLGIPDGLTDENGEMLRDYSADGVHLKKDGYVLWLNYLTDHTEG